MSLFSILLAAILTNYAIARIVTKENGPLHVFERWREFVHHPAPEAPEHTGDYARYEAEYQIYVEDYDQWRDSLKATVSDLFHCPYCFGTWSGLAIAVSLALWGNDWQWLGLWLAIVGGQHLLQNVEG